MLLYVYDILIVGKNIFRIDWLNKTLGKSFHMKDKGAAKSILGISISCDKNEKKSWLSQEHYSKKMFANISNLKC